MYATTNTIDRATTDPAVTTGTHVRADDRVRIVPQARNAAPRTIWSTQ